MFYPIVSIQKSRIDITEIKAIPIIISKTNFAFLYFFGRKILNKITVAYIVAKSISKNGFSTTDLSAIVPKTIIKKNTFSKVNNTLNVIRQYLFINRSITHYEQ